MIGKVLGGTAGIIAAPVVGGLVWRKARQHRVAKALEITTPNGIVEERFVRIGGIEQWIQLRGEDRDNPVLLVLHASPTQEPARLAQIRGAPPRGQRSRSLLRRRATRLASS